MSKINGPNKIFRPLFQTKELLLRLHVVINDDQRSAHNEFTFADKTYTKLDPFTFLTLEIIKQDGVYDPSTSILIGQGTINIFEKAFNKVLNNIYTQEIFANKGEEIIAYQDMVNKYTEKIVVPRSNTGVIVKPAVIYDENEVSYEGVSIYINKLDNVASLSINEFESLVYTLSKVDIFTYSQMLLNYYISYYGINSETKPYMKKITQIKSKHINWENQNKEQTVANFRKPTDEGIFDGIKERV